MLAAACAVGCAAQNTPGAKTGVTTSPIAASVLPTWNMLADQFVAAAGAMPADKYEFAPVQGEFRGVRTFAQQVKHVACANYGFFKQVRNEEPPVGCGTGGPDPAKSKAELIAYLRASFTFGAEVISSLDANRPLEAVSGPYGGTRTRLGMAVLAVWHGSDNYGQIVEYLRMNGIVPPASRPAP